MSVAGKHVFRVRHISGNDIAVVTEVKEDDAATGLGRPKEVRNCKVWLGGIDSFWLVTGVKKEAAFVPRKEESPASMFSTATSPLIDRIKGSPAFELLSDFNGIGASGKPEAVSFVTANRLTVGFSPREMSHEELVASLREGKLTVPTKSNLEAIEVSPDVWLTGGFVRNSSGLYGLSVDARVRSMPASSLEGKPEVMRLASGLVLFLAPPRWSPTQERDIRPEAEILSSAEGWLARISSAATSGSSDTPSVIEALRNWIAATVGNDEREDLEAALRVLSTRSSLLHVIPKMMERDPAWQNGVRDFERLEHDRIRVEVRQRLAEEAEAESGRLAELREQVSEAEARIATFSHREALLRSETEQHEARLQEKISEAARAMGGNSSEVIRKLQDDVDRLREEVRRLDQPVATPHAPELPQALDIEHAPDDVEVEEDSESVAVASDEDRIQVLEELSSSSGLSVAEVMAVILHSTEDVPVLVGDGSASIATDIATAVGGDVASIVFCDPTHVSLSDLLRDDHTDLGAAIEHARNRPDLLVPVALCGLTNGPCEYWLPQLVEMRRVGKLPRNLAFIASAGTDGMRVPVPKSVLRYLFPLKVSRDETSAQVEHKGAWRLFESNPARTQEAIRSLMGREKPTDPDIVGRLSDMLSRAPVAEAIAISDLAAALLREQAWTAAWCEAKEHELIRYFREMGN
ncbi:hypothetical protein [Neoaquamicrobium sediminum]|uniref:hypothetical protein n=1 Tax=Neoaquamicrobium sediminum TaxID=1849104 RepID=UPI003BAD0204